MSAKVLTVHNTEIHTAQVEVQTLTIKGRRVTLALYRQIQRENVIADDGTFVGLPWGTINYHHPDCPAGEHLHVIWQKDVQLRHAIVGHPDFVTGSFVAREPEDDPYFSAVVLADCRDWERPSPDEKPFFEKIDRFSLTLPPPAMDQALVPMFFEGIDALCHTDGLLPFFRSKGRLVVYPRRYYRGNYQGEEYQGYLPIDELRKLRQGRNAAARRGGAHARRIEEKKKAYNQRWQELQALPQLFIAG